MRKVFTSLLMILFAASAIVAQDYKSAGKAFRNYKFDKEKNYSDLDKAREGVDASMDNEEINTQAKYWLLRGEVYNEIAENELAKLRHPDAADKAFTALSKVLELNPKSFEKKAATDGLIKTGSGFQGKAARLFESQDYAGAFSAFNSMLSLKTMLDGSGTKGFLDDKADLQQIKYYTGMTAKMAGKNDVAKNLYTELYKDGYDDAELYKGLFDMTIEEDEDKAFEILAEGREKSSAKLAKLDRSDPENEDEIRRLESSMTGMLFSEINYYLGKGQKDKLEGKLKEAIEKDPNNPSLYSVLGKVYDDLYQQGGDEANFAKAKEYYEQSLSVGEKQEDVDTKIVMQAVYNLGALYFNKSAELSKKMNDESDTNKYNAMKDEVDSLFGQALPYFLKAETLDGNDLNTLLALKEIYARKDDFTKSNEYKARIAALKE